MWCKCIQDLVWYVTYANMRFKENCDSRRGFSRRTRKARRDLQTTKSSDWHHNENFTSFCRSDEKKLQNLSHLVLIWTSTRATPTLTAYFEKERTRSVKVGLNSSCWCARFHWKADSLWSVLERTICCCVKPPLLLWRKDIRYNDIVAFFEKYVV